MPTHIRFIRAFVLITKETVVDDDGKMVMQENQYHVHGGQLARISNIVNNDEATSTVTFEPGGPIVGVAYNLDNSNFEPFQVGASASLPDRGCCG